MKRKGPSPEDVLVIILRKHSCEQIARLNIRPCVATDKVAEQVEAKYRQRNRNSIEYSRINTEKLA